MKTFACNFLRAKIIHHRTTFQSPRPPTRSSSTPPFQTDPHRLSSRLEIYDFKIHNSHFTIEITNNDQSKYNETRNKRWDDINFILGYSLSLIRLSFYGHVLYINAFVCFVTIFVSIFLFWPVPLLPSIVRFITFGNTHTPVQFFCY